MRRIFKIILFTALTLTILFLCIFHIAEWYFLHKSEDWLKDLSSPTFSLQSDGVFSHHCLFSACMELKNFQIRIADTPVVLGDVSVTVPIKWPWRTHIKANRDIKADLTIGSSQWDIQTLEGEIGSFSFRVSGSIDIPTEQGQLTIHTKGLKTFIENTFDTKLFRFLLTNDAQTLHLVPKGGSLRLMGIPLIPLR